MNNKFIIGQHVSWIDENGVTQKGKVTDLADKGVRIQYVKLVEVDLYRYVPFSDVVQDVQQ